MFHREGAKRLLLFSGVGHESEKVNALGYFSR